MCSKFGWTVATIAVTFFFALMFLIAFSAKADELVLSYLSVEPDWLIRYYFDGRTVKV